MWLRRLWRRWRRRRVEAYYPLLFRRVDPDPPEGVPQEAEREGLQPKAEDRKPKAEG